MNNDELKSTGMHNGASPYIFRNAHMLRVGMTEAEKKLWEYLRQKPLGFKFRRQHPLAFYILDFYCHKMKLSIELDGEYHHSEEQKEKDAERTEYINSLGIREIRYPNSIVMNNLDLVIKELESLIKEGPKP
jgi:very-short-patch-repair endonuclease